MPLNCGQTNTGHNHNNVIANSILATHLESSENISSVATHSLRSPGLANYWQQNCFISTATPRRQPCTLCAVGQGASAEPPTCDLLRERTLVFTSWHGHIKSFIHSFKNSYSATSSPLLLRGAPDSSTVKKNSFKTTIECVGKRPR